MVAAWLELWVVVVVVVVAVEGCCGSAKRVGAQLASVAV